MTFKLKINQNIVSFIKSYLVDCYLLTWKDMAIKTHMMEWFDILVLKGCCFFCNSDLNSSKTDLSDKLCTLCQTSPK